MADDRCDLLCLDLPKAERLRPGRLSDERSQALAERARAFGDPTRLMLAYALAQTDELCVRPRVGSRVRRNLVRIIFALRTAGIVSSRRDGKMVVYAVTRPSAVCSWTPCAARPRSRGEHAGAGRSARCGGFVAGARS